ncbi:MULTISPECIES: class I SAM-dependent DNA methyltransferase [unclassified Sphingomonas]|uniref:class I SAM-dependent DNA methyltransferase n=1 Tax=unclassified Sphingomonas TaxID=196159 RepID=UPI000E104B54|nr:MULTISPECIES: class I SAM-dependent DNA methyltransferase [unclassified Sphingomonas]AXJ95107.1 SAM-dependent DNA methyltransferase [Sphingomonas sp. FARSPH]
MNEQALVAKVWNYAHVLREEGVSYGDYLGQISFLLFLKMDEERTAALNEPSAIPADCRWETLRGLSGAKLETHYKEVLAKLSKRDDIVGTLFLKAESKIADPARLQRLVALIDAETWMGLNVDVKGTIYEGLLERNAGEVRSGAGQYFTPRPLIDAIVEVMDPQPSETVHDPAAGTGGFLLSAYDHMRQQPAATDRAVARRLRETKLSGNDIVPEVVRLCAMNLYLHGIGGDQSPVRHADALTADDGGRYDVILSNPPFGKRQSFKFVNAEGAIETEQQTYVREDFTVTTGNKQLNFLQHIMTITKSAAAVVLPDNVLFEGGAGETLRRKLLRDFNFHTLLRLPTGIFYSQGVKANVLFFDAAPASERVETEALWVYDLRTNKRFTLRERPLKRADLDDFVACYGQQHQRHRRTESERFRRFPYEELAKRDKLNLDIFWLKDASATDPNSLPPPDEVAAEIVASLELALDKFRSVAARLVPSLSDPATPK